MDTTPRLGDSDNNLLFKICDLLAAGSASSGVSSFNARTGAVTLTSSDISGALAFTPANQAGDTFTGAIQLPSGLEKLKFGGSTSSFPALGNLSTALQVKLADDSNYAPLVAGLITSQTGGMALVTDDSASVFSYSLIFKKRGTTGDATAAVATGSEIGYNLFQSWNGAAYHSNAIIIAKTDEAQSSGHAGAHLEFRTSAVGAASVAAAVIVSAEKNLVIGNVTTTQPTSLVAGLVVKDGTAASADPTLGSAVWSIAGELQYRTSGASEGSGQTNHLHNRAAQQSGVGTDYTLTNATARVAFGTTNAEVNLPTAGTYLVMANVSFIAGTTLADIYSAKLRNLTDNADIGVNKRFTQESITSSRFNITLHEIVTVTALKGIGIFAFNETGTRGSIESTTTDIKFIRLS